MHEVVRSSALVSTQSAAYHRFLIRTKEPGTKESRTKEPGTKYYQEPRNQGTKESGTKKTVGASSWNFFLESGLSLIR